MEEGWRDGWRDGRMDGEMEGRGDGGEMEGRGDGWMARWRDGGEMEEKRDEWRDGGKEDTAGQHPEMPSLHPPHLPTGRKTSFVCLYVCQLDRVSFVIHSPC